MRSLAAERVILFSVMTRKTLSRASAVMLAALFATLKSADAGDVQVYPALPNRQYGSELYEVTVIQEGKSLASYVYKSVREGGDATRFSTDANHWTSFSFSGAVRVRIKLLDGSAVNRAIIRPLSRNIGAEVSNATVSFALDAPANVYVEMDSQPRQPLFIFANPAETGVPDKATENTIYFGPGVTDLGKQPFEVPAGKTVYLAGGAYVKGRLRTVNSPGNKAVSIRGRGILSGVGLTDARGKFREYMISATESRASDLSVEGIVITDSPGVSVRAYGQLTATNVKLLAWLGETDGISGGQNTLVQGCFLKVNDDVLHFHQSGTRLQNNVIWLQNFGSALQMGWNVTQSVDGETCDGLDIIGDDKGLVPRKADWANGNIVALIDMHNHATYKNIVIENVRHEKKAYQLFGVRTKLAPEDKNHDSYRVGLGSVEGMVFRNITAAEAPLQKSVFDGNGSEPGTISNVVFENIRIAGEPVTEANAADYVVQRGKTSGFRYAWRDK